MPRVTLNDDQRRKYAIQDINKSILDELNAKRGRERKTHQELAEEIGISKATWFRWNAGGIGKAEFDTVLKAAMKAGLNIRLEVSV